MLILLGPPFEGRDEEYGRLAAATGLLAYDLRTKLKPGYWGVVRALADAQAAGDLAQRLTAEGFRIALVDPLVGHDPVRRVVTVESLGLADDQLVLDLGRKQMEVPLGALLTVVRGEVRIGQRPTSIPARSSSSTFQAVNPSAAEVAVFRESLAPTAFDAFAAADLHFHTVTWFARLDARKLDFSPFGFSSGSVAQDLDDFIDYLAERAQVRVDRGSRTSSIASFTGRPSAARSLTPTSQTQPPRAPTDAQFDAYSRLVAEAERQLRRQPAVA